MFFILSESNTHISLVETKNHFHSLKYLKIDDKNDDDISDEIMPLVVMITMMKRIIILMI